MKQTTEEGSSTADEIRKSLKVLHKGSEPCFAVLQPVFREVFQLKSVKVLPIKIELSFV